MHSMQETPFNDTPCKVKNLLDSTECDAMGSVVGSSPLSFVIREEKLSYLRVLEMQFKMGSRASTLAACICIIHARDKTNSSEFSL
ncbi:hypothetical protein Trydic_g20686 [Trypoxylus dichotomus]